MKRHPVLSFVILSFVLSWSFWIPLLLGLQGKMEFFMEPEKYHLWGAYGPFFAAVIAAARYGGLEQFRRIMSRFFIWRVSWIWYVAALGLPALIGLLMTGLHMMFGGQAPDYSWPPIYDKPMTGFFQRYDAWTILIPYFLYNLFASTAISEEFGWRGFVVPQLQRRCSALTTSVFIGLVWGWWMWPVYMVPGYPVPYVVGLLGVIPAAILSTWIFNNTGGSLLLVVLFNNSSKVTDLFLALPRDADPLISAVSYWIVALAVCLVFGARTLTRGHLPGRCSDTPEAHDPHFAAATPAAEK